MNPFRGLLGKKTKDQPEALVNSEELSEFKGNIQASDLPMTLYLNQRLTFDILAALQGGFSNFTTVQTVASGETTVELSGEAKLGVSNVFAFLGVGGQLGGAGSKHSGRSTSASTTETIVHTPVSLFARLRRELQDLNLVRGLSAPTAIESIRTGDFIEFETSLRRHQVMVQLSALVELLPLFSDFEPAPNKGRSRRKKGNSNSDQATLNQIESMLTALTTGSSRDLVSKIHETNIVISTEQQYFNDPTMNDVIDGTFRVFGKVSRVVPKGKAETIGLLRKSPLGQFQLLLPIIQQAMSQFSNQIGDTGDLATEIEGPAVQVIPIAIFS